MRVYHERLRVPVSWWVLGMISVLTLGGGFLAGFDWEPALAVYGTLTVSLAAILIGWGLLRLEVADGELRWAGTGCRSPRRARYPRWTRSRPGRCAGHGPIRRLT